MLSEIIIDAKYANYLIMIILGAHIFENMLASAAHFLGIASLVYFILCFEKKIIKNVFVAKNF